VSINYRNIKIIDNSKFTNIFKYLFYVIKVIIINIILFYGT